MSRLRTNPNLGDGDGFYADLLASCEGLTDQETNLFFARLSLVLANHVGDDDVVADAIKLARMTRKS